MGGYYVYDIYNYVAEDIPKITVQKQPFTILTPVVKQRDFVQYDAVFTNTWDGKVNVTRQVVPKQGMAIVVTESKNVSLPIADNFPVRVSVFIGLDVPPGEYKVQDIVEYIPTQRRQQPVTQTFETDYFQLIGQVEPPVQEPVVCADFTNHEAAQKAFISDKVKYASLDGDNDGIACEGVD